jgi:hypothetical protein
MIRQLLVHGMGHVGIGTHWLDDLNIATLCQLGPDVLETRTEAFTASRGPPYEESLRRVLVRHSIPRRLPFSAASGRDRGSV